MNIQKNKWLFQFCLIILGMQIANGHAEIFKCTSKKSGQVYYNDKPCAAKDAEKKLNHVKDPDKVNASNLDSGDQLTNEANSGNVKASMTEQNSDMFDKINSDAANSVASNNQPESNENKETGAMPENSESAERRIAAKKAVIDSDSMYQANAPTIPKNQTKNLKTY